jgi:predicted nucleic acid-binding protein
MEFVVDTGPLSHLAKAGWLSILRSIAGGSTVVIPDAVETELRQGLHGHPHLQLVLDADWIGTRVLSTDPELTAFGRYAGRLVVGSRNVGEAAVLAYAEVHGATAIIDDGAGRKAAHDFTPPNVGIVVSSSARRAAHSANGRRSCRSSS